jgi:hypothetical protein
MSGRLWPWVLIVLALLPAALVHAPTPPPVPGSATDIVTVAVTGSPAATVDPAVAVQGAGALIGDNLFPTLFTIGPGGMLAPGLAVAASASGNVVTVQLGRNRLVNGVPLTPAMVVRALSRDLWPSTGAPLAARLLADVKGAAAVEAGKAQWVSGIQATGPYQLRFVLTAPRANWVYRLANPVLGIVPVRDLTGGQGFWTLTDLVGAGSWRLVDAIPSASMEFQAVGGLPPTLVDIQRYPRLREAALALVNGQVQAVAVSWGDVGQLPALVKATHGSLRADIRFLAQDARLALVFNASSATGWNKVQPTGPRVRVLVRQAFGGVVPPAANGRLPGPAAPPSGGAAASVASPLPVAVDAADPMALAAAKELERLDPEAYRVTVLTPGAWQAALAQGTLPAVLTTVWPGQPLPSAMAGWQIRPLAPAGALWLVARTVPHVVALPNGMVQWTSLVGSHG